MKQKFENIDDVPRYAIVKDFDCEEVKIVELSDSLREECYEEFKDENPLVYDEVTEFFGLDTNFNTVILAQSIQNVKMC